jgi:hypothetical protein
MAASALKPDIPGVPEKRGIDLATRITAGTAALHPALYADLSQWER